MEDHEATTQIALTVPNQPCSLPILHFDIMSFIAAYFISDPSNLLNYQLTCKEWYLASRPFTYRTISLRKIEDFVALFHLIDTQPMVEHWIHELKILSFQYHTSISHWEDPEGNLLFVEKVASYLSSHENDFYLPALRTLHLSGFYLPPPRTSQPQGVETSKAVVSFLDVLRTRFSTISKLKLTSCSFTVDDINILVFDLPRFRHLELCEIYNSCLRKDIIPTHGPPNLMSISCTESGDVCSNLMWWISKTPSTSTLQSIRFDLLSLPALEILDEFLHEMGPNLKFLDVYVDVISIERGRELDLKIDLSWNRSLEIITSRYAYYLGFIKLCETKGMNILENKASSATLVETLPRTTGASTPHSTTTTAYCSSDIPQMSTPSDHPSSPFSSSFDPNGTTPGRVASFGSAGTAVGQYMITPPVPQPRNPSRSGTGQSVTSPFSASFDPNVDASPAVEPTHSRNSSLSSHAAQEQWSHIVSSSLSALASQFSAASLAFAANAVQQDDIGSVDSSSHSEGLAPAKSQSMVGSDNATLKRRIEIIERSQIQLGEALENVRISFERINTRAISKEKAKEKDGDIEEYNPDDLHTRVNNLQSRIEGLESRTEDLEKKVEGIVDSIKLDQARLYTRLHNASVSLNKHLIKAVPMANGKTPPNFPATKGEFEHLTKERYEQIMKSYNIPIKGSDLNSRREAVREFIGLPPPGK
ncbi:hypothetical protein ABKN59_006959 [Abortiporus biennis]